MSRPWFLWAALGLLAVVAACSSEDTTPPGPVEILPTRVLIPTETYTATVTHTPRPTVTPRPTRTPTLTPTPSDMPTE